MIELERLLRSQGFGSRADCRALVRSGSVCVSGRLCEDPFARFAAEGLTFAVDGVPWRYRRFAYLALHKPAGYECSQRPRHHPGVYSLLPSPLLTRGVQAVGRLDEDTTGLLLLTDDGQFIHRYTSPKKAVPKVYEVTTRHVVDGLQIAALLAGVVLHDDPRPVAALDCVLRAPRCLRLTVTEGRYHLVKRMLAAAGNRVEALHRISIGGFALPAALEEGQWMWLEEAELALLAAEKASAF
ncbi:MAG: Ribosomal small subunit pseudouridine synthase A [Candidatus Accumulibacter appositus]|uniref:Pseudouridine synthase n=1 Tax=Candidatus Accumulibacter appositus TaxID=1454003 RepID=A0A011PK86_9PROT|nr:MAG: Ribosomal small subunit pseudouridine synthase A [Candidatus Accumulibacter appositus]